MTELFFPNRFTVETYSGKAPDMFPNYPEELKGIAVPIEYLIHVTHSKEASEICQDSHFEFKARKKFGKTREYDGRSCGDTFRPSQMSAGYFFKITDRDAVFPGYYSWWSVHLRHTQLPDDIQRWLDRIKEEKPLVPDYLNVNPHSRYGNHAFVHSFKGLLTAYANARDQDEEERQGNVCIRKGGTLRYKSEICYVLIICTDNDDDELADFDPLQLKSPEFQTNGLIRADGRLANPAAIATFYPRCIISSTLSAKYSYENVAFAFYFPEDRSSMLVDRCAKERVGHNFCIKTQPTKLGGWKCPNEIAN